MSVSKRRDASWPPGLAGRLDPVCNRFEELWLGGAVPLLEEFLPLVAEADRPALVRELLLLELHYRRGRGEQSTAEEYQRRLPLYAGSVAAAFSEGDAENAIAMVSDLHLEASLLTASPANHSSPSQQTLGNPRPAAEVEPELPLPSLPGYEILGALGRGGMGVVYLGRHLRLNRLVAVKMVLAGGQSCSEERIRFLAEAEAVAALQHANVVQVYDFGQHEGLPYMVLEYIDGGSLHDWLRDHLPAPSEAAALVERVARGVAAAHAKNIIHRDLKPQNILLRRKTPVAYAPGSPLKFADIEPKVTDFGLAKRVEGGSGLTRTGAVVGTPSYMAPEQAEGKKDIGPAADVYALGAILYECLTGRPPFRGSTPMDTILQVIAHEPLAIRQLQPNCPRDLETICHKCLRKDPAKRYDAAEALAEDLHRFQKGEPIQARPLGTLEIWRRWCGRNRALAVTCGLSGLALLTIMVLLAIGVEMNRRSRDQAVLHADQETKLRREADRESARMLLEQSLSKCRLEDAAVGVHWLGKSLQKAMDADAPDLEREVRLQLAMWSRELHQLEDVLPHSAPVSAAIFSPDGRWLATRTNKGVVALWDAATRQRVGELPGLGKCRHGLAFAPDSKCLAVAHFVEGNPGTKKGQVVFHDVPGLHAAVRLLAHDRGINDIVFSEDGKKIVTGSVDRTVRFWDAATGDPLPNGPFVHNDTVEAIALGPDGAILVTSTGDYANCKIQRWEVMTGKRLGDPLEMESQTYGLAFHPGGKTFLTGSSDLTARQWVAETGQPTGPIIRLPRGVWSVGYSKDGRIIATGSADKTARLWDQATGQQRGPSLLHQKIVRSVAFSPEDRFLLSGSVDQTARLWRLGGWTPSRTVSLGHHISQLVPLPGSDILAAVVGFEEKVDAVVVWNPAAATQTLAPVPRMPPPTPQSLAVGDGRSLVWLPKQGPRFLQLPSGQERPFPVKETELMGPSVLSSDNKILAARIKNSIGLWDMTSGQALGPPLDHPEIHCLAFSPNGTKLLSAGLDNMARLWEVPSGRLLFTWRHADKIQAVAFSSDGKLALTGGDDYAARLWDIATGQPAGVPLLHSGSVMAVAFSPDGKFILTGNQNRHAALWDVASRRQLGPSLPHPESVLGVAFLKDGKRFVTGCYDGKLRLFDFPDPKTGDPASIQNWIETITGQELGADGSFRVLGAEEWRGRPLAGK